MPDNTYDATEAQFLISAFVEKTNPTKDLSKANMALITQFLVLMKDSGFQPIVQPGTNNVEYLLGDRMATVGIDREGIFVAGRDGQKTRVRLAYDRQAQALRSTEKDSFRVPTPGQPVPYRSALAELANATISKMNQ